MDWVRETDGLHALEIGKHIGTKIILMVSVIVTFSLCVMMLFHTRQQELGILRQNERDLLKLTESVSKGLQTVMLNGYADIAQEFADQLKSVAKIQDFRILRATGFEAFRNNDTINAVNERLGEEEFIVRDDEYEVVVLPPDQVQLQKAIQGRKPAWYYETDSDGAQTLTIIAPILNREKCHRCHGEDHSVRGVLKLTTDLDEVHRAIETTRRYSFLLFGLTIVLIVVVTSYMVRRSVVRPVELVTRAMSRASAGDLTHKVPVIGRDELSNMAASFNRMMEDLLKTHQGLEDEQNKLATIILSAREGIVATDDTGVVVLVNPAAERLLDKSAGEISRGGFLELFDEPEIMEKWLRESDGRSPEEPAEIHFKGRILSVYAGTILTSAGDLIGSAALIREITREKELEAELRRLSNTDALTDLYNRRYLDETLASELARATRHHLPLSIFMSDVDHFKRFNDEHGHEQGDRVLQAVAECMKRELRNVDRACRYGGEEFLAILPHTTCEQAWVAAERLRNAIATMRVDGLQVTISIGIAEYPTHAPASAAEFIEIADGALYEAKHAGRNRTEIAPKRQLAAGA